jgi:hypothetical protein
MAKPEGVTSCILGGPPIWRTRSAERRTPDGCENLALAGLLPNIRAMKFPLFGCSLRALLGAFCFLSSAILVHAQETKPATLTPEQTKAAITKLLNDFLTFNSDPAQHDRFWADDLVYTSSAGTVKTKPDIIKAFADAAKAAPTTPAALSSAYSAEDVLVRLYGDTAALTFRLVARSADGSVATFRNSGTLLHRNGKWQVVTWQATKEPAAAK